MNETVQYVAAGAPKPSFIPGDFVLVHSPMFISKVIRFGQRLRFRGADRKFAYFNHAAVVVNTAGDLIEATGSGVRRNHITEYDAKEYVVVHTNLSSEDQAEMLNYIDSCLGDKYGFITIASIAISLLTGTKFNFGYEGHMICSGLVATGLERGPVIFDKDAVNIMPADLAKKYNAIPPTVTGA